MAGDNIVKEAVAQVLSLMDDVTEKVRENLGYWLGMEEVTGRYVRGLTRKSLAGNIEAYANLEWLYAQQKAPGENPMDEHILFVLNEERG